MATSTAAYKVGDRVTVTAATGGFGAAEPAFVVGAYHNGTAWVYVCRVQDDVDGTADLHLLTGAIAAAT